MLRVILKVFVSCILTAIGWTDYKTMEIPDYLTIALGVCGLGAILVFPEVSMAERLIGAVCISFPMYLFCRLVEGAFGDGDIFLLSVMGFYLGWKPLMAGTFIGFLIGGIQAGYLLMTGKVKRGEGAHMAFGPALCIGLMAAQFYGEEIIHWYLKFFY